MSEQDKAAATSADTETNQDNKTDNANPAGDEMAQNADNGIPSEEKLETNEESNALLENLRTQLESEKQKSLENRDLALRAQAEMENLRKRTTRDIENAHKYALEKFVNELLPILDSMEMAINAAETAEKVSDIREGMELTLKMFSSAVEKFGVKPLQPEGEKFNPELHEAVSMQEIEGKESGTVVSIMQKGYELNGRLVRPAMVIVAK